MKYIERIVKALPLGCFFDRRNPELVAICWKGRQYTKDRIAEVAGVDVDMIESAWVGMDCCRCLAMPKDVANQEVGE
jgi:hypothetical protein